MWRSAVQLCAGLQKDKMNEKEAKERKQRKMKKRKQKEKEKFRNALLILNS